MSHLAWRFREWYRCPRLLAAVAGPPLREVLDCMVETTNLGSGKRRPFVLYSCHDVTLLSLLYAVGVDFLVSGKDCGGKNLRQGEEEVNLGMVSGSVGIGARRHKASWRWWPAYSSTIVFELVRVQDLSGVEGHVIRVISNGNTLRTIPRLSVDDEVILNEQALCSRQRFGELLNGAESRMLRLTEFSQMVSVLEAGGKSLVASEDDSMPFRGMYKLGVDNG